MDLIVYILLSVLIVVNFGLSIIYLNSWKRIISIISFLFAFIMSMFLIFSLLGNPVSINLITKTVYNQYSKVKIEVAWFDISSKDNIKLLIKLPSKYLFVTIPWNKETAEKLQEYSNEAAKNSAEGKKDKTGKMVMEGAFSLETRENKFKHEKPPETHEITKPRQNGNVFNLR